MRVKDIYISNVKNNISFCKNLFGKNVMTYMLLVNFSFGFKVLYFDEQATETNY